MKDLNGASTGDVRADRASGGVHRQIVNPGVLRIVLDSPDTLNALSSSMLAELAECFEQAGEDNSVRAVVVSGAGRGFCSGIDLGTDPAANGASTDTSTISAVNRVTSAVMNCPKPTIAAVNGPAVGFGVSLAVSCDLVLARESTYFMLAFAKIGLMPDGGATALLAASVGRTRALRLALLAERLGASQALQAGLVTAVYDDASFEEQVSTLAAHVASGPTLALAATKRAINEATIPDLSHTLETEHRVQAGLLTSWDFNEGCASFRERRAPKFSGGKSRAVRLPSQPPVADTYKLTEG